MPELKCLAVCGPLDDQFEAGRVYPFDEEVAARHMRSSPGSWEVVEGTVRVGGPDEYIDYSESAVAVEEPTPEPPVAESSPVAGGSQDPEEDEDDDVNLLDAMTLSQLRVHAQGLGIDLGSLRSKSDIVAAIERGDDDSEGD